MDILRKHWPPLLRALAHLLLPRAWGEGPVSGSSPHHSEAAAQRDSSEGCVLNCDPPAPRPQPWTHTCARAPGWASASARAHPSVPAFPMALGTAGEAVTAEPSLQSPQWLVLVAFVVFPPSVAAMLVL